MDLRESQANLLAKGTEANRLLPSWDRFVHEPVQTCVQAGHNLTGGNDEMFAAIGPELLTEAGANLLLGQRDVALHHLRDCDVLLGRLEDPNGDPLDAELA